MLELCLVSVCKDNHTHTSLIHFLKASEVNAFQGIQKKYKHTVKFFKILSIYCLWFRQILQMMCLHLAASVKRLNQFVPHYEFIHIFSTEHPWAKSLAGLLHGAYFCVLNEILASSTQYPLFFVQQETMESNSSCTFSICVMWRFQSATLDFWTVKYNLTESILKTWNSLTFIKLSLPW